MRIVSQELGMHVRLLDANAETGHVARLRCNERPACSAVYRPLPDARPGAAAGQEANRQPGQLVAGRLGRQGAKLFAEPHGPTVFEFGLLIRLVVIRHIIDG
jgi:hypothetical protein